MRRVSTRALVVTGLLLALFLAGVASFYASSHPDGLEYVAEQAGFADTAQEHATAGSPLADYATRGVSDQRVSGGLAGVAGVVIVGALGGGLAWVLRRRRSDGRSATSGAGASERDHPTSVGR
jgi:hypothetical protein